MLLYSPKTHKIKQEMTSLEKFASKTLNNFAKNSLLRHQICSDRKDNMHVERGGKQFISFSCNDYLNLSHHDEVKKAAINAINKYGVGAGASRAVTGNNSLYKTLEEKLAQLKSTESAIVFGSGYLANIGTIPALVSKGDLIVADKLAHACILDGAKLSGAKLLRFSHNNVEKCAKIIKDQRNSYKNCLIITDGVFSMDGDLAPLDALYELAEQNNCWLMSDDAHGVGILNQGSGSAKKHKPHFQMGTLSKAIGGYGGYVCASKNVIEFLRNKARSVIYSTALPPATLAAAIAAIDIINDSPELVAKPLKLAQYFTKEMHLPIATSSIVPLIIGSAEDALYASKKLENAGFLVSAIRPPTVAQGTSRLRFTFSAQHTKQQVDELVKILRNICKK